MADNSIVTEQKLKEFYNTKVKPYLGGGLVMTELYNGNMPTNINESIIPSTTNNVVMSDDIENYKFIVIECYIYFANGNHKGTTVIIPVDYIKSQYTWNSIMINIIRNMSTYVTWEFGFYDKTHMALCLRNASGFPDQQGDKLVVYGIS